MEIQVLGPLSAHASAGSIVPSAGKPRQILALLALHANQVVPAHTLMEELWDTDIPRSGLTTLQTYILHLRRLLGRALGPDSAFGAKEVLATRHGGYLLHVQPGGVDVQEYDHLAELGRDAADAGDDETAALIYRKALAVWRGPALVDVKVGPVLEIQLARLEESRLRVLERRIEADLRLGRHADLVAELTSLIVRHPLHEGLHAQCMAALYRSGRQWHALEVYRSLRGRLVEELGLEPSQRLRKLHQAILAADPVLDVPVGGQQPILDLFAA